jgi:hypothetical protein
MGTGVAVPIDVLLLNGSRVREDTVRVPGVPATMFYMTTATQSSGVSLSLAPTLLVAFAVVVLVAGLINGVAGFGFATVGTMALATAMEPATAVVVMIVPILTANLSYA